MSEPTKGYGSLGVALAATLGVVSGLALAGFALKSPKAARGG
jgi:hypothetical protein